MKSILIPILLLLLTFSSYSQVNKFKLEYKSHGLGSNTFSSVYPIVEINESKLTYQTKSGSYRKFFAHASIDSITKLISGIKDSLRYSSNECIHSGRLMFLSITNGSKVLVFASQNTIDPVALKIIYIVNAYLPKRHKILVSEKLIQKEKECDEYYKIELQKRKQNQKSLQQ